MNENILGIIGTAGRGEDGPKLNINKWNAMKIAVGLFIKQHEFQHLVSGGAAYADHIAVQAFNAGFVKKLELKLPVPFNLERAEFESDSTGQVANLYHRRFHVQIEVDSLAEIKKAIELGAEVEVGDGFFVRNRWVAQRSHTLLALTFGEDALLKDGGTKNTMGEFIAEKTNENAWHIDLNTMKIFQRATV